MEPEVLIFCEGASDDSQDAKFYGKLFGLLDKVVVVRALGGKRAIRSAARGFLRSTTVTPRHWVIVQDRDFDVEPNIDASGVPSPPAIVNNHIRTSRSCIESFFLEPNRLQNYFANHSQGDLSASIHSSFELAVNEISDYQAVRWALQRQATAWRNQSPWFGTTWTGKDSPLPEDLSFQSCVQNATQSRDFHSAAFANKLDLGGIAQEYRDRFAAPVANPVADYRWWYNGKDLQRVLMRHLSGFDFRKFYDWCIDRATIADYPDLQFINDYIGNLN